MYRRKLLKLYLINVFVDRVCNVAETCSALIRKEPSLQLARFSVRVKLLLTYIYK